MDSATRFTATIRNPSASDIESLLSISEMANPELHTPLRLFHNVFTQEQISFYKTKLIEAVATYLRFAGEKAEQYITEFENDVKLQPDKRESLFQIYRTHHVAKINEYQRYSYLYNEYFKGELNIGFLSAIANELWHIAYKYNEKLIDALFLLQRIYGHFLTVEELNLRKDLHVLFHISSSHKHEKMESIPDKEYFLPLDFPAIRYGAIEDLQNKIHGPSYKFLVDGTECIVYTDRLNSFLKKSDVKVSDIKADFEDVIIDGKLYQESYKKGYEEGLLEFDKKYNFERICPILGIEKYIESLKAIKFNECKGPLWSPGLEGIRHSHIGRLSHKIIKDHGYYAGMYSQIERLMSDYEPIKKALSVYPPEYLSDPAPSTPTASDGQEKRFNSMPLSEVRRWFTQLANNSSKNGSPFLTVDQVGQFIDRAFCGNVKIEPLTFNMSDGERTSITKLFYLFFIRCTNDYAIEPTKHCKEKYVRLLTDNFTNYQYQTVFSTFNNSKNAPKEWKTTV